MTDEQDRPRRLPPLSGPLFDRVAEWERQRAQTFTADGDPRCLDCGGPAKRDGRHLCEMCEEGKRA